MSTIFNIYYPILDEDKSKNTKIIKIGTPFLNYK